MPGIGYLEPLEQLSEQTIDMHKAIVSLIEEFEAVDAYNQRADVCHDPDLKVILEHNRDEEKEHAAMLLEWVRRHDPALSKQLEAFLFSTKKIVDA
jgi:ferritin-like protein